MCNDNVPGDVARMHHATLLAAYRNVLYVDLLLALGNSYASNVPAVMKQHICEYHIMDVESLSRNFVHFGSPPGLCVSLPSL